MADEKEEKMMQCVCGMCGYIYDPTKGDKKGKISPGVEFEDLTEDWKCPLCRAGKSRFEPMRG